MNQDLRGKAKNGIVINEPTEMKMSPMKEDVPGKGKNKMEEETKQNNIQRSEQNINKKKRVRVKKKNQIINSNEAQLQNTTLGKGQPSSKKTDTTTKPSEQNTSNKEDNNTPINNDQNSRHSFQENNTNGEKNTNLIEEEGNSRSGSEQNNNKNNHAIDPGDAHNTYLKLISGTSLEEDKESENMYISNNIQMAESSFEDDGEEDSEEDGDYEDDMSIEETDNFESVDSESFQNEDQPVNHTIDDHAALLIETFNSNALVEINVSSKIDKIVERDHLSPRGRGRGRNNIKRGSHKPRGKGGRFTYQQVAVIPQEQNLSN
ncbi:PREDICTED: type-2 histone deacetylase 2-like [Nicotiana attenuata]|nr:PREDICTED: type-2 histone deacetylase 2-like [Nicotiana attenuata]